MNKLFKHYLSQIFPVKIPQKQSMQEIYTKITTSLNKAYQEPQMIRFISSLSVQSLLYKSVEYYVGSRSTPRNQYIMRILLQQARIKSEAQADPKLINLVKYYQAYYIKMSAIKEGSSEEYDMSSDMFMQLAESGDTLSNYLVGKQIYKMVQNGQIGSWKDETIITQSKQVFTNSICEKQYGGLYYIADIDQKYREQTDITQQSERMLFQLYSQAASLGYVLAYFKIAMIYKKKGNYHLYKKYLVKGSESGVIQAQHNLALEYVKGQHFPKDEVKGLAWFMQAGAYGFVYSKYNLSKILAQGTSCGRLKPNKKASLVYLEEINRSGQLDVSKQIQQILRELDK